MPTPSLAPGIDASRVGWVRAEAQWKLDEYGAESPYMAVTMQAALDTVAWVEGQGPAPLSGDKLVADEAGLALEEARAADQEFAASGEAMWRPGRVLLTLMYLAGDPTAESPT